MSEPPGVIRVLRAVERKVPGPLTAACLYEAAALHSDLPTISVLMHRHKWVFPVFCVALGLHVWFYDG